MVSSFQGPPFAGSILLCVARAGATRLLFYVRPLERIAKLKMLTSDEQNQLLSTGKLEDRNRVIESCLRWAKSVAHRFSDNSTELDAGDLLNEATIGLIEATKRFDPEKGVTFLTYANWWMVRIMANAQGQQGPVKVPRYKYTKGERAHRVSLEAPYGRSQRFTVGDMLEDLKARHDLDTERGDFYRLILEEVDDLDPRSRMTLVRRFWQGMTLQEVGEEMGCSRERVRQIERRALNELKLKVGRRMADRPC